MPRLIYKSTGQEVRIGDVIDHDVINRVTIIGWEEPHKPESSGFVLVRWHGNKVKEPSSGYSRYYAHVFGLEFVDRTDRD